MALTLKNKSGNFAPGNFTKGKMPSKNYINIAKADEEHVNVLLAVVLTIAIVAAAALFSKFAVIDRFAKVDAAEAEVAELQRQIDEGYDEISGYGELTELYAHYTYSNMTDEELTRVDRIKILDMLRKKVMNTLSIKSWTVTGDKLTLTVHGLTLEQIDLVFRTILEEESIVDYYMVNSASTGENRSENPDLVTANVTVMLTNAGNTGE